MVIRFRLPSEARDFPFLHCVHVPHSVTSRVTELFLGGSSDYDLKQTILPSSDEVKNTCIYTFTPMRLHGVVF